MKTLPLIAAVSFALSACQTAPAARSGFLLSYDGLATKTDTLRASVRQRRDNVAAAAIDSVWLEPSVLLDGAAPDLNEVEKAQVLREVDRQICYEVSERFNLADSPVGVARLRTGVVAVRPTGAAASGVAAVANILIPGPGTLRVPGTTGGLAAETELLGRGGDQLAALAWARNANVVGMDAPSLSRVGDALQLAESLGDAVGDAISQPGRPVRKIADRDPCARYGPRFQPAGLMTRMLTGVYVPQLNTGSSTKPSGSNP